MKHDWQQSSGTTDKCTRCGWYRNSLNERDEPISRLHPHHYDYSRAAGTNPTTKDEPPCVVAVA